MWAAYRAAPLFSFCGHCERVVPGNGLLAGAASILRMLMQWRLPDARENSRCCPMSEIVSALDERRTAGMGACASCLSWGRTSTATVCGAVVMDAQSGPSTVPNICGFTCQTTHERWSDKFELSRGPFLLPSRPFSLTPRQAIPPSTRLFPSLDNNPLNNTAMTPRSPSLSTAMHSGSPATSNKRRQLIGTAPHHFGKPSDGRWRSPPEHDKTGFAAPTDLLCMGR